MRSFFRYPDPPRIAEDHPALTGINTFLREKLWPAFRDAAKAYEPGRKLSRTSPGSFARVIIILAMLAYPPAAFGAGILMGILGDHVAGVGGAILGFLVGFGGLTAVVFALGGSFRRTVDEGPTAPERAIVAETARFLGFERGGKRERALRHFRRGLVALKDLKVLPDSNEVIEDRFVYRGEDGRIELADVTITSDVETAPKDHWVYYFRGLVIVLPNLVRTSGRTIGIGPRRGRVALVKRLRSLDGSDLPEGFQPLALESEGFNAAFALYTDDQVGARRALTPVFMERVLELQTVTDAVSVDFLFEAERTTIALDMRRDPFDYGTGKRLLEPEELRHVIQEFVGILRIYETLTGEKGRGGRAETV